MPNTILIVDDEPDVVEILSQHFVKNGFRVLTALDGETALETARRSRPDLVLLDWMLPAVSGVDVLKLLRSAASTRAIPVILLTARREEVDRLVGLELGADDYVTKPFSPREVVLRTRAVLRRHAEGVEP